MISEDDRESPAVVIDVKRLRSVRTINGYVYTLAFRKNRLSITLYRSAGVDSNVAWSGSLAILMKSFFIGIWIENVVTVQSKRTAGIFISYRVGEKAQDQNAKQPAVCGVRNSESGEKNRISLLCKAALGQSRASIKFHLCLCWRAAFY